MDFICIEIDRNEPTWFKFEAKIDFICTEIDRSEPTWFKFDAKMDFICIEIDRSNWTNMVQIWTKNVLHLYRNW